MENKKTIDAKENEQTCETVLTDLIGAGTVIDGHLNCAGNIEIRGIVHGDVSVEESLFINGGQIDGDVKARNVHLGSGLVNGTVTADGLADLNGMVHGKIEASQVYAREEAHLLGETIDCRDIAIRRGAKINAKITTSDDYASSSWKAPAASAQRTEDVKPEPATSVPDSDSTPAAEALKEEVSSAGPSEKAADTVSGTQQNETQQDEDQYHMQMADSLLSSEFGF